MPGGNLRIVLPAVATRTLIANEVGLCNLPIASPVAFDCYEESRDTGAFIRRAGEVAKLFVEVGLIVLGAFISPFRAGPSDDARVRRGRRIP